MKEDEITFLHKEFVESLMKFYFRRWAHTFEQPKFIQLNDVVLKQKRREQDIIQDFNYSQYFKAVELHNFIGKQK